MRCGAVSNQILGTRFSKVAVINQRFTAGAREQTLMNRVVIVERDRLTQLLAAHPPTNYDLDQKLQQMLTMAEAI